MDYYNKVCRVLELRFQNAKVWYLVSKEKGFFSLGKFNKITWFVVLLHDFSLTRYKMCVSIRYKPFCTVGLGQIIDE